MIKFFVFFYFISFSVLAGELDGKGLICKVYGDTVGYFFDSDRAYEYKISGGKEGLEYLEMLLDVFWSAPGRPSGLPKRLFLRS